MSNSRKKNILIIVIAALVYSCAALAQVTVDPFGFALSIAQNDNAAVELTLTNDGQDDVCLLYTSPSPRDGLLSRMPSSA